MKLKDQEIYLDDKMHELLLLEGQLLQQRTDLEIQEKHLCDILHASPVEYHLPLSLVQINEKLEDHIKLLEELQVNIRKSPKDEAAYDFSGSTFDTSVVVLFEIKRLFRTIRMDTVVTIVDCRISSSRTIRSVSYSG